MGQKCPLKRKKMIHTIKYKGTPKEVTAQWLKGRANGIGASEVASAMGLNKFCSLHKWWEGKVANRQGIFENHENKWTDLGHRLEEMVAQKFEDVTGHKIIKASAGDWCSHNDECEFAFASPDRLYWIDQNGKKSGKNAELNKGLLECKTTKINLSKECDEVDFIQMDGWRCPLSWYLQVQWQMYCTGKRHGAIACYNIFLEWEFYFAYIDYNEEMVNEKILPALHEAWDYVVNEKEPPIDTIEDVEDKYPTEEVGNVKQCDTHVFDAVEELKGVKNEISKLKKKEKELSDAIKVEICEAESLAYNDNILATYKAPKESAKFDVEAFKADNPSIYTKYLKTTQGARVLRLK